MTLDPLHSALLAILLIVFAGFVLRATGLVTPKDTAGLERVSYYVLYPALFIETILKGDLDTQAISVAIALLGAVVIIAAITLILQRFFTKSLHYSSAAFTSVFQGSIRWQTFIALAVAKSVFGAQGAAYVAIAIATMTPILNVLCVWVMVRHGRNSGARTVSYMGQMLTNPMILSCLLGLALKLGGVYIPMPVAQALSIAGQAGLATALILVGTGLELRTLWRLDFGIIATTLLKMAALPACAYFIAYQLGVHGIALQVVVLCAAVPSASASYILARQMGGDAPYMARILTFQNIVAMVSLPLVLAWMAGI